MSAARSITIALCMGATAFGAVSGVNAQSRGPAAQYWIDLSTSSMSIPGMPEDNSMAGGLPGGMMGGGNAFGGSMGMGSHGQWLNAELYVRAHPSGTEGTHAIPAGMNMGPSLLLMPYRPKPAAQETSDYDRNQGSEKPKGRLLLYWGCGDTVRPGQPKVLDFSKPDYSEYARFFSTHAGQSKGVQGRPGHALWPNEKDSKRVPDGASLQGDHAVSGDGVPASLKFTVGSAHDFLPKARLTTKGMPKDGVQVEWNAMQNAKAFFLHAQGAVSGAGGGQDMILWSSSERPENGWALMSYQSPTQVSRLLQQKVVLSSSTTTCMVPKGIFDKAEGAMVNMIAYGPELNLSHPPRPLRAPAAWQPEWTARVRIKSTGMTMLGMEGGDNDDVGETEQPDSNEAPRDTMQQVLPAEVANPVNLLRGLLGR